MFVSLRCTCINRAFNPWPSFEKSVQHPATHVKSLNNLATMYYRLGQYIAIVQYPHPYYMHSQYMYCVCLCIVHTGQWAKSEQMYKESLEQSGDHETTYNNLGKTACIHSPHII